MYLSSVLILLAFVASIRSAVIPNTHVVHEKRGLSKKWVKRDKLAPTDVLSMRIGLKQRNLDRAEEFLMKVAHPESNSYGKHWSSEEVIAMFSPEQKTVDVVTQWLTDFGIHPERITHSDNKGWLALYATTEEAEQLLHTEYHLYNHTLTGHMTPACDSYHVPKSIREHIDYITPGVKLLAPTKRGNRKWIGPTHAGDKSSVKFIKQPYPSNDPDELATCDRLITPACIRALYKIPEIPDYPYGIPRSDNSLGIFEEGDAYTQIDLDSSFTNFTRRIPNGTHPILASINGGVAPVGPESAGGESSLDFSLAFPIIYPQSITLFQTDDIYVRSKNKSVGSFTFNTFLDAIDGSYCTYSAFGETGDDPNFDPIYPSPDPRGWQGKPMCGVYKPTNVISISYGVQEYDLPAYYQQRQCNEFLKLGLQGVSIIFASGDDGVAGRPYDDSVNGCIPDPKNGSFWDDNKIFNPNWPNNVGATKVYPGKTVYDPESAVVDPFGQPWFDAYSSGGGFSNIYPRPDYQKDAVATYFRYHNPPYKYYEGGDNFAKNGGIYNRIGRGYPDVSANGDNIALFWSGDPTVSGGTSASAPIFASIINLINEARLNAGKKPVGFINPALYSHPEMLNDITNGTNPGCGTEGFKAAKGWDPVTGLGTPNYEKMLEYFMKLP